MDIFVFCLFFQHIFFWDPVSSLKMRLKCMTIWLHIVWITNTIQVECSFKIFMKPYIYPIFNAYSKSMTTHVFSCPFSGNGRLASIYRSVKNLYTYQFHIYTIVRNALYIHIYYMLGTICQTTKKWKNRPGELLFVVLCLCNLSFYKWFLEKIDSHVNICSL